MGGLRDRALRLLGQREHSRAELARKLRDSVARAGSTADDDDAIMAELDRLAELGLQSDARFAESWVRSHAARHGTRRLRHDLQARGVARELIDAALSGDATGEDEATRLRACHDARFGTDVPADRRDWARRARFLAGRGFDHALINRLLPVPRS